MGSNIRVGKLALIFIPIITTAVLISCATVDRVILAPPEIPGAEFVGAQACAECHEEVTRDFGTAAHARLVAKGNGSHMGCESCHGPGSVHAQAGGGRGTIVNPGRNPEACFACHLDKRGEFHLPTHHPVLEGKMSCADCHDPHRGSLLTGKSRDLEDTCGQCHTAQRGPFVFEHEAVREGCTSCHNPHGSVNDKMLVSRNANLCLKCHFQHQVGAGEILIGSRPHRAFLNQGTCWSAGCHEAVHGSQIGSSLRF